jgi:hypothetical protein
MQEAGLSVTEVMEGGWSTLSMSMSIGMEYMVSCMSMELEVPRPLPFLKLDYGKNGGQVN